ncbi:hypothetical protein P7D22_04675 [Lichenihabitans sp. Uapishka_5]|uniref:hypothetical protein n=1 Tax=Lichenihabitans sp. Uapishka_5 TaxID=3037302 RepID=UPI0029E7D99C|nr:hypothetical protein [Lichenihabitans sp. Uapishka_5]MDX7950473.1 hypothetical protein [Lichenihabitans sp. Uapishka_5]
MAIHVNSTPVPARPLLAEALPSGGLLPDSRAELLAILDAGPLPHAFMTRHQRETMQAGVDALIEYLDAITPDADLEPCLGANEPGLRTCGTHWHQSAPGLDLEADPLDSGEHDPADWEPSLGAQEHVMGYGWAWARIDRACSQAQWGRGGRNDLEDDHDGREPDVDDEDGADREHDCAEAGIADMDGMCEQVQAYDGFLPWANGGCVA